MKKSLLKNEDLKKQKYSWVRLVLVSVLILVLLGMGLYKAKNGDVWKLSLQLLTGLFLIEYGFSNYKRQKQHDKSTAIVDELIEDADEKLNQLRDSLPSTFELKRILMKRSWREGRFVEDFYKTQMPEERKKAYDQVGWCQLWLAQLRRVVTTGNFQAQ
jgi:hypothetical protein